MLLSLLSLQRPHGGVNEGIAAQLVLNALPKEHLTSSVDSFGNIIVRVGAEDNGLWFTAHLDTVHRSDARQSVVMLADSDMLVADDADGKPCVLGADDAAGVYLLVEMIRAGKPGNYAFFLGEECGGLGSSDFIRRNQNLSASMCVSFDRRGYTDVITHQVWNRTASDEFAKALSSALNETGFGFRYKPCDTGVYTDSEEFAGIVPECTNISVGYFDEHTTRERLDLEHLLALRDAVLAIDWTLLPIKRVPVDDDWLSSWNTQLDDKPEPYIGLGVRCSDLLSAHWSAMPPDVRDFLCEMEEILNG